MAVTVTGRAITLTAVADAYDGIVSIVGMTLQGTGLTAGQRLLVTDTNGSPLADYEVEAAVDNADLWGARQPMIVKGVKIPSGTVGGTWVLTIYFE
ncbi:MAG: hypothetical protein ABL982_00040 [Vicinamibacterales bacterium]